MRLNTVQLCAARVAPHAIRRPWFCYLTKLVKESVWSACISPTGGLSNHLSSFALQKCVLCSFSAVGWSQDFGNIPSGVPGYQYTSYRASNKPEKKTQTLNAGEKNVSWDKLTTPMSNTKTSLHEECFFQLHCRQKLNLWLSTTRISLMNIACGSFRTFDKALAGQEKWWLHIPRWIAFGFSLELLPRWFIFVSFILCKQVISHGI